MSTVKELIGLVDFRGPDRDALAEAIARDGLSVMALESVEQLPEVTALVVAHVRALPLAACAELSKRLPVLVVSDGREDEALVHAVDAGLIDYVAEPLRNAHLLRRMIRRVIKLDRLAAEQEEDRLRLEELNERLETHLELLRLDQQAGGQIQRKLLPPRPQTVGGIHCDYWLAPSLYLSGDFLDFQRFDDRYTLFYFADVSGHGASSAFVTVLLRYLFNRLLGEWDGNHPEDLPANWMARLNQELLETGIGKHATLVTGVIDHQQRYLHYSLGAQLPVPLLVVDGQARALSGEGMPVGLFPDLEYPRLGCALAERFQLWLCSDGVLECLPGETLEERLADLERRVVESGSLTAFRKRLAVDGHLAREDELLADDDGADKELPDDLTIMTLGGFGNDDA
jgi:serine phosphatase RsbU (regulator of sigma subunit)